MSLPTTRPSTDADGLEWNWAGLTGFFWAPIATTFAIWTYFRMPEFKDRSYYELDILFERRIPARKFKSTVIEADADEHTRQNEGLQTH